MSRVETVFLIGLVLLALVGVAAWFGWRWYTTPVPPNIPLDGASREVVAAIEAYKVRA